MTTYGVDTSHWKPLGDFPRMKASGRCDYLITKATEGTGYVDPSYATFRAGSKAAGMLFGSFHFLRPGDPIAQADFYLANARPVAGEIPVLDVEDTAIPDAGNAAAAFLSRVKARTGTVPLTYTYPDYLATHDFRPVYALGSQLWFADYADPVNSTAPWPSYAIRQFTDKGAVPGQPGTLDCNSSPLTLAQLRGLAIGAASPQEDFMAGLTDAEQIEIRDTLRELRYVRPPFVGAQTHTADALGDVFRNARTAATQSTLAAKALDPVAVAAALAKLLPAGSAPTDAQLDASFKRVLGSLDNTPAS